MKKSDKTLDKKSPKPTKPNFIKKFKQGKMLVAKT